MNKQRLARIITLTVLAVTVGIVVAKQGGFNAAISKWTERREASPQDAIFAMLDAAREGNVDAYLAQYTGPMEQALRKVKSESPDFARGIRESGAGIKGIAVLDPEPLPEQRVKARVEFVFEDRTEAQTMFLEKTRAGWKIAAVESAERIKTLVPYGTPVQ
ncbi:MAG: hypothetical protein K2X35_15725 [Bryobacteraceae bacterium]|nr:hypothetical protein [Bryobacteraceae bacterium]